MKANRIILHILVLATALWGHAATAVDMTDDQILQRFEFMRPTECKKIWKNEPKNKIDVPVFSERNYLDIDGDGICEIIDSWVDRLTPRLDDYRLVHLYATYRYDKGRWHKSEDFQYVPKYQLRDKATGRIYYLFDFKYNTSTPVVIEASGVHYFDRLPTPQERKSGMVSQLGTRYCSYDFVCDGLDLGHVVKVLLKYRRETFKPIMPLARDFDEIRARSVTFGRKDRYLDYAYRYLTQGRICKDLRDVNCFYCGLPSDEIDNFKQEQKRWLAQRDEAAAKAGLFGSDEYIEALIGVTSSRNTQLRERIEALPKADPRCQPPLPELPN